METDAKAWTGTGDRRRVLRARGGCWRCPFRMSARRTVVRAIRSGRLVSVWAANYTVLMTDLVPVHRPDGTEKYPTDAVEAMFASLFRTSSEGSSRCLTIDRWADSSISRRAPQHAQQADRETEQDLQIMYTGATGA